MFFIENNHEPIIDREEWIQVQEMKGLPLPEYMQLVEFNGVLDEVDEDGNELEIRIC